MAGPCSDSTSSGTSCLPLGAASAGDASTDDSSSSPYDPHAGADGDEPRAARRSLQQLGKAAAGDAISSSSMAFPGGFTGGGGPGFGGPNGSGGDGPDPGWVVVQSLSFTVADPRPPTAELALSVPPWVRPNGSVEVGVTAVSYIGNSVDGAEVTVTWRHAKAQGQLTLTTDVQVRAAARASGTALRTQGLAFPPAAAVAVVHAAGCGFARVCGCTRCRLVPHCAYRLHSPAEVQGGRPGSCCTPVVAPGEGTRDGCFGGKAALVALGWWRGLGCKGRTGWGTTGWCAPAHVHVLYASSTCQRKLLMTESHIPAPALAASPPLPIIRPLFAFPSLRHPSRGQGQASATIDLGALPAANMSAEGDSMTVEAEWIGPTRERIVQSKSVKWVYAAADADADAAIATAMAIAAASALLPLPACHHPCCITPGGFFRMASLPLGCARPDLHRSSRKALARGHVARSVADQT